MASYGNAISRTPGADPLVPQPLSPGKASRVATPDVATMRNLQKQRKAMPPSQPGGRPKFQIRNADDLDNAIKAVGRVKPDAGETKEEAMARVRRFVMTRAKQLGLSSRIPPTWGADGSLKDAS